MTSLLQISICKDLHDLQVGAEEEQAEEEAVEQFNDRNILNSS